MAGQLASGTPATYAVWEVEALMVQQAEGTGASWSTDPRARTPLLPALEGYALAGYEDYGSGFDSEFYGRLGAQWTFTPNFGVAGDVKLVRGGDRQWFVGPRLRW